MKDIVTPVPPEEIKGVIRKCLEQAAQLNYERIKDYAKIEGNRTLQCLIECATAVGVVSELLLCAEYDVFDEMTTVVCAKCYFFLLFLQSCFLSLFIYEGLLSSLGIW